MGDAYVAAQTRPRPMRSSPSSTRTRRDGPVPRRRRHGRPMGRAAAARRPAQRPAGPRGRAGRAARRPAAPTCTRCGTPPSSSARCRSARSTVRTEVVRAARSGGAGRRRDLGARPRRCAAALPAGAGVAGARPRHVRRVASRRRRTQRAAATEDPTSATGSPTAARRVARRARVVPRARPGCDLGAARAARSSRARQPSGLQRAVLVGDSASGVSSELDWDDVEVPERRPRRPPGPPGAGRLAAHRRADPAGRARQRAGDLDAVRRARHRSARPRRPSSSRRAACLRCVMRRVDELMRARCSALPQPGQRGRGPDGRRGVVVQCVAILASPLTGGHGWFWLTVPLAYGFLARVATGPTLSPLGQFATRVAAPRIGRAKFVPGPPKRFAQLIGAVLSSAALVCSLASRVRRRRAGARRDDPASPRRSSRCSRSALGCAIFGALMRAGVIPQETCIACADVSSAPVPDEVRAH